MNPTLKFTQETRAKALSLVQLLQSSKPLQHKRVISQFCGTMKQLQNCQVNQLCEFVLRFKDQPGEVLIEELQNQLGIAPKRLVHDLLTDKKRPIIKKTEHRNEGMDDEYYYEYEGSSDDIQDQIQTTYRPKQSLASRLNAVRDQKTDSDFIIQNGVVSTVQPKKQVQTHSILTERDLIRSKPKQQQQQQQQNAITKPKTPKLTKAKKPAPVFSVGSSQVIVEKQKQSTASIALTILVYAKRQNLQKLHVKLLKSIITCKALLLQKFISWLDFTQIRSFILQDYKENQKMVVRVWKMAQIKLKKVEVLSLRKTLLIKKTVLKMNFDSEKGKRIVLMREHCRGLITVQSALKAKQVNNLRLGLIQMNKAKNRLTLYKQLCVHSKVSLNDSKNTHIRALQLKKTQMQLKLQKKLQNAKEQKAQTLTGLKLKLNLLQSKAESEVNYQQNQVTYYQQTNDKIIKNIERLRIIMNVDLNQVQILGRSYKLQVQKLEQQMKHMIELILIRNTLKFDVKK
ncbi:Hypothetical_protein [Hexamita inflata]|uniref:Hypothetical_protein n=1 Tax=Hexamita inflata TaxID=28002 RepID=A0AA86P163_9EUKA|nr:Hypothetical protein HINF_LOCUS15982 [Hexamita inflata]